MGRVAKIVVATAVVGAAGAGAVVYANSRSSEPAAAAAESAARLSTTTVTQKDLTTYDETTATLGFTVSVTVSSPVEGTITSIASTGDTIDAGGVVATIDGSPVVALIGDIPGYRDLTTDSADGADVRQLEANLVALGFDPEGDIVIDEEYDDATEDVVTLWEVSLGIEGDGEVPQSQVVYVPGRLLVDSVTATVGGAATAGSTLMTGRQAERKFLVSATVNPGGAQFVDLVAAPGTPVTTGTVLFWDNYVPVIAIEGDAAAVPALTRDLYEGVADGADVKLLEQMLTFGGFDPGGAMTVDDHFDTASTFAVAVWRQSLGLAIDVDLTFPAGGFVVVPSDLFVGSDVVANGTQLMNDGVVVTLTSAAREVSTTAPIGDPTFAVGATIDVVFPDGTIEPGTVVAVGNVASNQSVVPGETPTVTISIHVEDIPDSVDSFVQIPVTLRVVAESLPGAFVVPVSALVALAEGGYALEVVTGTNTDGTDATTLVAVEPGLFTDGFVSITGDQLTDGLTVVVPS